MSKSPADDWRYIPEFPLYMINREWEIRNTRTGAVMRPSTDGNWTVYLYKSGKQYHRAVRPLFYSAFPKEE